MRPLLLQTNRSELAIEFKKAVVFIRIPKQSILMPLLFFCFCFLSQAQINLDSSLVAYYPFNGNANDESGNGNDGIVNGATLTLDRFNNPNRAYDFDGFSNFIDIPFSSSFVLKQNATICGWIKPSTAQNPNKLIFINLIEPDNWGIHLSINSSSFATH